MFRRQKVERERECHALNFAIFLYMYVACPIREAHDSFLLVKIALHLSTNL